MQLLDVYESSRQGHSQQLAVTVRRSRWTVQNTVLYHSRTVPVAAMLQAKLATAIG